MENDPDHGERKHFLEVCYSLLEYRKDALAEVEHWRASACSLDARDRKLWGMNVQEWVNNLQARVNANGQFLDMLPCPEICAANIPDRESVYNVPPGHIVEHRNSSKVRSTLRQFVRDWAVEGENERKLNYMPIIDALMKHMPPPAADEDGVLPESKPRVLCPGSGLGRLPYELAKRGYAAQGNEFSYHMILGCNLILSTEEEDGGYMIYPYVLNFANKRGKADCMTGIKVPDVCPADSLPEGASISMAAGEFVEVYKDQKQEWDAVATAFFLDTAKNVFLYIRTIADLIKPGGLWTNIGPLLYHYAEMYEEISVELSFEEVRPFICQYFDFIVEERRDATYTSCPESIVLRKTVFHCIFFVARRNERAVVGRSNPVY